ncbi:MAG: hypothetical protein J7L96_02320 [Bacteroidales bacterium]|nr:hypothetical protein [Bacteroidales bacterium]
MADIIADTLTHKDNLLIIKQLLGKIHSGQIKLLESLAARRLEDVNIKFDDIPEPPKEEGLDARLWYTLAIARMGNFEPLDTLLDEVKKEDFSIFWGNSQTLYDRISMIRPVPKEMRDHLLNNFFDYYSVKGYIIWAVTGIADAEGRPIADGESNHYMSWLFPKDSFRVSMKHGTDPGDIDLVDSLPIDDKKEIEIIKNKPTAKRKASKPKSKPKAKSALNIADTTEKEPSDERRINVQIIHNKKRRKTFVGGVKNIIRCWIGMPELERAAVSDEDIPFIDAIPEEGLKLTVMLRWKNKNNESKKKILWLPADRSERSNDCNLEIDIPENERYVSAEIMFQYKGYAYETVWVEADVLAPDEQEDPNKHKLLSVHVDIENRGVINLKERNENNATFTFGNDTSHSNGQKKHSPSILRVFGSKGVGQYNLSNTDSAVKWLNNELFVTEKSLVRRRAKEGKPDAEEILDTKDQDMLKILRTFARHGTIIYQELRAQKFKDPGERIQILNNTPDEYVPLEFAYDRGSPAENARLCEAGMKALESDVYECPVCKHIQTPYDQREKVDVICPLGFWSLQKIIERKDLMTTDERDDGDHPSYPRTGHRTLDPIDTLLFASSDNVSDKDRTEIWKNLERNFKHPIWAKDWEEWKEVLEDNQPPLLLMLPHHGVGSNRIDYLEIGIEKDQHRLERDNFLKIYTNPKGKEPGPIVILLGCRTAIQTEVGYTNLGRRFQQLDTSIVVGTLSKILGRHAAPVARELVSQLATVNDPEADFGTIMRRVRRRMFAKGYLLALSLVALGDSGWQLKPRPDTDTDTI